MIEIQLNEKSAENVKAIQELRTMGFSDGLIQEWLNNSQKNTRQEKQKPRTNFDRITESVESLARYIENYTMFWWKKCDQCETYDHCNECIKEWLQKEIEND